ncbi:MAG: PH domain-containing protein [Desertimonas sp.]
MHEVFRPTTGRVLTAVLAVIAVIVEVWYAVGAGLADAARVAPFLAVVVFTAWMCFWRPRVEVTDAGVTLVNVLRTVSLPWPSILDVDTKWTLSLTTGYGRFDAWAAPAPGTRTAVFARRSAVEARHVPASARVGGMVRPGDLPSTSSGATAEYIRRRWEELREAGHLDTPRLEHERVPQRWHLGTIVTLGVLIALCIVSATVGQP